MMETINNIYRLLVAMWAFAMVRLLLTVVVIFYPVDWLALLALPTTHDVLEYSFVASALNFLLRGTLYGWSTRLWHRYFGGETEVGDVDAA